jgi:DNA-binding NarL/FixJ family response regulator
MRVGLLVEDHQDAREWLKRSLSTAFPGITLACEGTLAGGFSSLDHLCNAGGAPDIALIDLGLPDGSGVTLIRELAARAPECLCVVATRYEDDDHLFAALKAGARGYLLKQRPQAEITRLLAGIANGEPALSPVVAQRLLSEFGPAPDAEQAVDPRAVTPAQLTPREREVLSLITKGHTLARIGNLLEISRHTVAAHVKRIYEKLGISSRAEASLKAIHLGLTDP